MTDLDAGSQPWFEDLKTKKPHLGSFLNGSWKTPLSLFWFFSVRIPNQQEMNITGTPLLQINEGRKKDKLEPLSHMTGTSDFMSFTILGGMRYYLPLWPWVNISVALSSSGSCFQLLPITVRTRSLIYTNQRVHELICMCMCAFWRAREHACTLHAFSFTSHSFPPSETLTHVAPFAPTYWSFYCAFCFYAQNRPPSHTSDFSEMWRPRDIFSAGRHVHIQHRDISQEAKRSKSYNLLEWAQTMRLCWWSPTVSIATKNTSLTTNGNTIMV